MDKRAASALFVALLVPTWAGAADKLEGIKLVWKPTTTAAKSGGIDSTGIAQTKIQLELSTDTRENAELIGENRENKEARKVTTHENVPRFIVDHMKKVLTEGGLSMVDADAEFVLNGELQKFFVDETSEYKGELRIRFVMKDRSGHVLWTAVKTGSAGNHGRSYKDENYYETFSNMIISAAVELFKDAGLRGILSAR